MTTLTTITTSTGRTTIEREDDGKLHLEDAINVARMLATPGTEITITIDRPNARTHLAKVTA